MRHKSNGVDIRAAHPRTPHRSLTSADPSAYESERGRASTVPANGHKRSHEGRAMSSRIEDYAMIGDGRTGALVSRDGSIDWLCLPRFDSDACCAALLGRREHGFWRIAPCGPATQRRAYSGDTLVLETEFDGETGCVRLTDFMPVHTEQPMIVRRIRGLRGTTRISCELGLRFDYGYVQPRIRRLGDAMVAVAGPDLLVLRGPVALQPAEDGVLTAEMDVAAGQDVAFVLSYGQSHCLLPAAVDAIRALEDTLAYWREWSARFSRETPWRDAVMRSLLTLRGLTYHPTGGMVAALTTSLPEMPGGSLNWDYRYCWLRDATFTVSALLNAGYQAEATLWRDWMLRAIAAEPDKMRIMYRLDGGRRIDEATIEWLPGYEGAAPVRLGNAAAAQRQIDVVGELLDALDLMARGGVERTDEALAAECELAGHLERTWQDSGHGLWESRGQPQHYTYSKVMAWTGVDRLLSGYDRRGAPDDPMQQRMRALRTRIHQEVSERSWNFARGHFVDRYGGERLDGSLLLLPLVGFLPAEDPRMSATIDAVERSLSHDGLVWRTPQGTDTAQGAFIACSCWLADCRAMQGRRDEAVAILERVLSLRNDVGLLSEEYHPGLRRQMGNFPQALSHLALVNTALGLSGPVLQRGGG
jgi:GH15 family glucan-1,4-alpha-glucosidase